METKGRRERVDRLRELDEAAMAFKVARRAAMKQQGWLRAVRRAVGVPAAEAAVVVAMRVPAVPALQRTSRTRFQS